jgi:glycerol kinase
VGVGLDNQGETVVAWNKSTGQPIYNAIVWQCRRTSEACERLKARAGLSREIRSKTGLVIDPYFSATKLRWLIDNVKNARGLVRSQTLLFGTSDSWLLWKMTGGQSMITDPTTASRTMLFNIHKLEWDADLLQLFKLPKECLPSVVENSGQLAYTDPNSFLGIDAPISGLIVDQQAALFGHGCFKEGELKNTYGTGCFMLMNTGNTPKLSVLFDIVGCDPHFRYLGIHNRKHSNSSYAGVDVNFVIEDSCIPEVLFLSRDALLGNYHNLASDVQPEQFRS